jgi:D-alanine-D-alanine ligase
MGGPSSEREISIKSGKAVCNALRNKNINCIPIELIKGQNTNGYRKIVSDTIISKDIDVAFIALHGEFGEDGTVQELLEELNIPYTGSRPGASRLAMDKIMAKHIFRSKNIPVARDEVLAKNDLKARDYAELYFKGLSPDLVVKPCSGGSSIGLNIVSTKPEFYEAVKDAFKYSDKVIIEKYIPGREITVGIIEDKTLPIVEIVPKRKFFDFTAKYEKGLTDYLVPAEMDKRHYKQCQEIALRAHKALGARSFSRVDMILSRENRPVVLEVNAIPGLTETSLLPKAALADGIDFEALCIKILESAW